MKRRKVVLYITNRVHSMPRKLELYGDFNSKSNHALKRDHCQVIIWLCRIMRTRQIIITYQIRTEATKAKVVSTQRRTQPFSAVSSTVHTSPSRKRSATKMFFKREEFKNDDVFCFSVDRKHDFENGAFRNHGVTIIMWFLHLLFFKLRSSITCEFWFLVIFDF